MGRREREREVERIESVVASVDANPWHSGSFTGGQKSRVRGRDDRANRCLAVKRISFVESQLARVQRVSRRVQRRPASPEPRAINRYCTLHATRGSLDPSNGASCGQVWRRWWNFLSCEIFSQTFPDLGINRLHIWTFLFFWKRETNRSPKENLFNVLWIWMYRYSIPRSCFSWDVG